MKILELERRTGLDRATIRYYEREGLICPKRGENSYRDYSDEEATDLLKIRLLRQLGMPLYQIKQLREGTEDFSIALAGQIDKLSQQIQSSRRERDVCQKIRTAGVGYRELDAAYYLHILEQPMPEEPPVVRSFREPLPQEIHPWRRFLARCLDISLLNVIVLFLLIVVFRVRPAPGLILQVLLLMACMLLQVPLEALTLTRWGTTPGKWVFGIHLESMEDRYLTWDEALERSFGVYIKGMGLGIPYVRLFCNQLAYCKLTGRSWRRFARYDEVDYPQDMDWDYGVETTYGSVKGKWGALFLAVLLILGTATAADSIKPKYRGNDLTITEFARNYNASLALTVKELNRLNDDGGVKIIRDGGVTIYMDGTPENEHQEFGYETENGYIRTITYENVWTELFYLNPVGGECYQAAVSVLLAQKNTGLKELREFEELWNQNLGQTTADFTYHGIRIQWNMELENCEPMHMGIAAINGEKPSKVVLHFHLEV